MLYPGTGGGSFFDGPGPEDDAAAERPRRRRGAGGPADSGGRGGARAGGVTDVAGSGGAGDRPRRQVKQMALWLELPILLVVAFCLAVLIRTFLVQAFYIPSGSMENTLLVGDRVLVNKVVYDVRTPERGEVVVFRGTDRWAPEHTDDTSGLTFMTRLSRTIGDLVGVGRPGEKDFIKRVIGVGGDTVSCCDEQGRILVNGVPIDEPYIFEDSPLDDTVGDGNDCRSRRFQEIVIPDGQIFVMGDHRSVSQDARCQGPVPVENVVGQAFVIVWPRDSWAGIPVPEVWDDVPASSAAPQDTTPDTQGGFVLTVPLLASLAFKARSRSRFSARRRRLPS
ncbi:signal peptidase I [Catenuloplanes nepalensis]|uniref:Signal peptidase I n=2 Tax=Catenuloplanes nepalensis TaxID=587533 RepID=A0ABT9N0D3_9ACTN|nr:signal peptidase I [Catenuloplanes nepalensis]